MRRGLVLFLFLTFLPASGAWAINVPPLAEPAWLAEHLEAPDLSIIEVSNETSFLFDGHIPGARLTTKSVWREQDEDGALVHLPADTLQTMFRDLGVNDGDGIVIYYKGNDMNEVLGAYYLYWLLHRLGHTNVGMLGQGWHGWQQAEGPVEDSQPESTRGDFVARPLPALELSTDELAAIREDYPVVDGRPATHFAGTDKFPANPKFGRIEGTINKPWEDFVHETDEGRLYMKPSGIESFFEEHGITRQTPFLITCLGGTGGAIDYAMFYQAGFRNMRVHDAGLRSWNARDLPLIQPDSDRTASGQDGEPQSD